MAGLIAQRADQLPGKVVVDLTNPLNFETFDSLTVPAVKAFDTTFAATLASGKVGPLRTTVLVAGDDTDAKELLIGVVTAGGLHAIDAGELRRARELEALGFLQLTLAISEKVS